MNDYIIKKGDSLWKIAKENKLDLDTLMENNNLNAKSLILPGQKLILNKPKVTKEYDYDETQSKLAEINALPNQQDRIIQYHTTFKPDEKYILEDKKTGKMFVYKGNQKLSEYNVGHGKSNTDDLTITKRDKQGNLLNNQGNMSTGAGVYQISGKGEYHHAPSFQRQIPDKTDKFGNPYNIASSIHWSPTIRKESNGCSRLDGKCLEDLKKQNIKKGTNNYILPEKDDSGEFYATSQGVGFKSNLPVNRLQGYSPKNIAPIKVKEKQSQSDYASKFLTSLQNNKEKLAKDLDLTNDEYDKLVKTSYGLLAQETNYGKNEGVRGYLGGLGDSIKVNANIGNPSLGGTQVKITNVPDSIRTKYNLTKQSIHESPEQAAIATISKLAHSYKNELPSSKKKSAEDIDLGLRILHQYGQKGTNSDALGDVLDKLDVFDWHESDNEKNKKKGSVYGRYLNNKYSAEDDAYYQKMKKAQGNVKITSNFQIGGIVSDSTRVQQREFKPLAPTLKQKLTFPSIKDRMTQQKLNQREDSINKTENRQIAKNVFRAGLETLPGTSTVANAYGLVENVAKGNYADAASYGAGLLPIPGAKYIAGKLIKTGLNKFNQLGTVNTATGKSFNDYKVGGKLKFQDGGVMFLKNKLKELYDKAGEMTAEEYAIQTNELNKELKRIDPNHEYQEIKVQSEETPIENTNYNTNRISEPIGYQGYKHPNQPYLVDKIDSNIPRVREGKSLTERLAEKYAVKPQNEPQIDMNIPRAKSKREPIADMNVPRAPKKFKSGSNLGSMFGGYATTALSQAPNFINNPNAPKTSTTQDLTRQVGNQALNSVVPGLGSITQLGQSFADKLGKEECDPETGECADDSSAGAKLGKSVLDPIGSLTGGAEKLLSGNFQGALASTPVGMLFGVKDQKNEKMKQQIEQRARQRKLNESNRQTTVMNAQQLGNEQNRYRSMGDNFGFAKLGGMLEYVKYQDGGTFDFVEEYKKLGYQAHQLYKQGKRKEAFHLGLKQNALMDKHDPDGKLFPTEPYESPEYRDSPSGISHLYFPSYKPGVPQEKRIINEANPNNTGYDQFYEIKDDKGKVTKVKIGTSLTKKPDTESKKLVGFQKGGSLLNALKGKYNPKKTYLEEEVELQRPTNTKKYINGELDFDTTMNSLGKYVTGKEEMLPEEFSESMIEKYPELVSKLDTGDFNDRDVNLLKKRYEAHYKIKPKRYLALNR